MAHAFAPASAFARSCEQLSFALIREPGSPFGVKLLTARETAALGPLLAAVRAGKIDLACLSLWSYAGELPEATIVAASNMAPAEVRRNGGAAALDALHVSRLGVKYLGWIASGLRWHLYLAQPPVRRDGLPVLTGLTIRAEAASAVLAAALGADLAEVDRAAVYGALPARLAGTSATPGELFTYKWATFLEHRIDAPVQQSDVAVLMNAAAWQKLDEKRSEMLVRVIAEHEEASRGAQIKESLEHDAALRAAGVTFHALGEDAAAKFSALAAQRAFARGEAELTPQSAARCG